MPFLFHNQSEHGTATNQQFVAEDLVVEIVEIIVLTVAKAAVAAEVGGRSSNTDSGRSICKSNCRNDTSNCSNRYQQTLHGGSLTLKNRQNDEKRMSNNA